MKTRNKALNDLLNNLEQKKDGKSYYQLTNMTSELNDILVTLNKNKLKLFKKLESLNNQMTRLEESFEREQKKLLSLPKLFSFKLRDAASIENCSNATVKLVNALDEYESAVFDDNADPQSALVKLNDVFKEFGEARAKLPSHAEYKKLGLILAGVSALVMTVSTVIFMLGVSFSATGALLPLGFAGGMLAAAGMSAGAVLTGVGMFLFAQNNHTTGMEMLKAVDDAALKQALTLKSYDDKRRPKNN